MTHFAFSCVRPQKGFSHRQCWGVLVFAACSWLTGIAPGWSEQAVQVDWSTKAWAQSVSQIRGYAGAVLEIEPLRREAYRRVRRMMNGNVPNDVCRQGQLPGDVNGICSDFFDRSANIIRKNNLSIREFNELTQRSQSDGKLMKKIQQELIRQQR
jgi:hypothetical protein